MKNTAQNSAVLETETDPTERLCSQVLKKIEKREISHIKLSMVIFSLLSITGIILVALCIVYLINDFSASGIYTYLSALFADGYGFFTNFWTSITSLADFIPLDGIMILLSTVLISLLALRKLSLSNSSLNSFEQNRLTA